MKTTTAVPLYRLSLVLLAMAGSLPGPVTAAPPVPEPKPLSPGIREAGLDEAEKLIKEQKDANVLDVRSASEYSEEGHLPRALLVDFFREDFVTAVESLKLNPAKPCLIYCAVGGRSRRAAEKMVKMGYKDLILLHGGLDAWKTAGKPVEGGRKN